MYLDQPTASYQQLSYPFHTSAVYLRPPPMTERARNAPAAVSQVSSHAVASSSSTHAPVLSPEIGAAAPGAPKNWYKYCPPCHRWFVDEHGFSGHLTGKKHALALKKYPGKFSSDSVPLGPKIRSLKPPSSSSSAPPPLKKKQKTGKKRKSCRLCNICSPDNNSHVAHLYSKEHADRVMTAPLVVQCAGCLSSKILLSSWDAHYCANKLCGGMIDCYVCNKSVHMDKWYDHSRDSLHQNHLRQYSNMDIYVRTCSPCGDMLVMPHCWHLHENSREHYGNMAAIDPQRKPFFFNEFIE